MGSEKSLWQTFKSNVSRKDRIFQRHEDTCSEGIPDVSYSIDGGITGWIELKYTKEYPKRPMTPVRCDHFTQEQRYWLEDHGDLGTRCCVLWQIENDYYVINWDDLVHVGEAPKAELIGISLFYSHRRPDWEALLASIIGEKL